MKQGIEEQPSEACGFILEKNNYIYPKKTLNISKDKSNFFLIDPLEFLKNIKDNKILYIYHTHTNDNIDFSETDKKMSNLLNISLILYNIKYDVLKIYSPYTFSNKYIGRYFEYGKYDCFTLIKDFYQNELNKKLIFSEKLYALNLKELDLKKIILELYEMNSLELINSTATNKYDIILLDYFRNNSPKHFGLYLGDDLILHHPAMGFSKIEEYNSIFKKQTHLVLRNKNL